MTIYLLDTNIVSLVLRGHSKVLERLASVPMSALRISAITEAELHFGLAKRPLATNLHKAVAEFLLRVDTLPFTSATALTYGSLRATLEAKGKSLAAMDMLIAAQAVETKAILVTNDAAFKQVSGLTLEDWSA